MSPRWPRAKCLPNAPRTAASPLPPPPSGAALLSRGPPAELAEPGRRIDELRLRGRRREDLREPRRPPGPLMAFPREVRLVVEQEAERLRLRQRHLEPESLLGREERDRPGSRRADQERRSGVVHRDRGRARAD